MADCYAPEADDLQRRWLPREIFADIGIADPEPLGAVIDAAPPAAATAVSVEELAAQLAGMLGSGPATGGKDKRAPPPLPPVAPAHAASVPARCHRAPVCGLEGAVVMAYGGGGNVVAGGAAVAWPVTPYSPVQWQVASNFSMVPPAAAPRGGTGVFLPRTDAYRHAPPPAKDAKAPSPRTVRPVQKQPQPQQKEGVQHKATAAEVALALPLDWSYH